VFQDGNELTLWFNNSMAMAIEMDPQSLSLEILFATRLSEHNLLSIALLKKGKRFGD